MQRLFGAACGKQPVDARRQQRHAATGAFRRAGARQQQALREIVHDRRAGRHRHPDEVGLNVGARGALPHVRSETAVLQTDKPDARRVDTGQRADLDIRTFATRHGAQHADGRLAGLTAGGKQMRRRSGRNGLHVR